MNRSVALPIQDLLTLTTEGKSTCLIPYGWSQAGLPDFQTFISSNEIFKVSQNSGLLQVSCPIDRIVALNQLSKSLPLSSPTPPSLFSLDPYAQVLASLNSEETRDKLVSPSVFAKATDTLQKLLRRSPHGLSRSEAEKSIFQTCSLPIPFEWFSSELVFIPGNRVYFRLVSRPVSVAPSVAVSETVTAITEAVKGRGGSVDVQELSSDDLSSLVDLIDKYAASLHWSPFLIYSGLWPQDYLMERSSVKLKHAAGAAAADKSAFGALVDEVLSQVRTKKKVKSELIEYWCACLGVSPKWVYQSIRDQVIWSHTNFSDMQILLRKKQQSNVSTTVIPYQLADKIVEKVREGVCQIDLLTKQVKWTRNSELRNKYGPLHEVLRKVPEIFFDPEFMYDRESLLTETIGRLPEWDKDKPGAPQREFFDRLYVARRAVHDRVVAAVADQPMEYSKFASLCQQHQLTEELFFSDFDLFFPLKNVFRRKASLLAGPEGKPTGNLIDEAVLRVFEKTKTIAIDVDALVKSLVDCEFEETQVQSWQSQLSGSDVFFHDPHHVYSSKFANQTLLGTPFQSSQVKPVLGKPSVAELEADGLL